MSVTEACRFTDSGTIDAGVPKVLDVIDMGGAKSVTIVIKNTGGSNAINSTVVEYSPLGDEYAADTALGVAIGSAAAGAKKLLQGADLSFQKLRITLNSTSGTTYKIELRGAL